MFILIYDEKYTDSVLETGRYCEVKN